MEKTLLVNQYKATAFPIEKTTTADTIVKMYFIKFVTFLFWFWFFEKMTQNKQNCEAATASAKAILPEEVRLLPKIKE